MGKSLYITISLPDVTEEKISLTDTTLIFNGKSDGKEYEVNIEFFKPVDSKDSTYNVLPRSVQMHVMKKSSENDNDEDEEFWPRLLKNKNLERNQVKIDWDRYVDEDEEEENFDLSNQEGGRGMGGGGNMDMNNLMQQMGNMGGMGGMGGMPGMGDMAGMPGMGGMGVSNDGMDDDLVGDEDSDDEELPPLEAD